MKSKYYIFTIIFLVAVSNHLAISQFVKNSMKPSLLRDGLNNNQVLFFRDNEHGWLTGDFGKLQSTEDGGTHWKTIKIPIESSFIDGIHFSKDEKQGWAVGGSGTIILTKDGGNTWVKATDVPVTDNLRGIYFTDNLKYGIATGSNGTILISQDGGVLWKKLYSKDLEKTGASTRVLRGGYISEDGKKIYVYGDDMYFLLSNDNGRHWVDKFPSNISNTINSPNIYSMFFDNSRRLGFASCAEGNLLKTVDGGQSWKTQKIASKDVELNYIHFDTELKLGWIVTDNGGVLNSFDGGKSWKVNIQLPDSVNLKAVKFSSDSKYGWICGDNGFFMKTTDFGKTWLYSSTLDYNFYTLKIINSKKAVISTEKGLVILNDNKALDLHNVSPINFRQDLYGLYVNERLKDIWVVGEKNIVAKCNLYGSNWSEKYRNEDGGHFDAILMNDEQHFGIAVGSKSKVIISNDGGESWRESYLTNKELHLSKVYFKRNSKEGWILGNRGSLFKTLDSGKSWTNTFLKDTTQDLRNIVFDESKSSGYIVTASSKEEQHLYNTLDEGKNWKIVQNFPYNKGLSGIAISKTGEIVILSTDGKLYKSIDSGTTWFLTKPQLTYQRLTDIQFDENNNIVAIGYNGVVLKGNIIDTPPLIKKISFKDSGNYVIPAIQINDKENNVQIVDVNVKILSGQQEHGIDAKYLEFTAPYSSSLPAWPKDIFKLNQSYSIRFTISDGWNAVCKDTVVFFGESFWTKFKKFMYWQELPQDPVSITKAVTVNFSGLSIFYAVIIIILFFVSPYKFVLWHEAVSSSRIPLPEKLSKYYVLTLIEHDRCLDAFVKYYRKRCLELFESYNDVNSRPHWVPAPFEIDGQKLLGFQNADISGEYIPGLTEIKNRLKPGRVLISIEGQGGIGKSSLAFQLARWAVEDDAKRRLFNHMSLPLFISTVDGPLDTICLNRLAYLTDSPKLSDTLGQALLRKKRITVIVDGVSESTTSKRDFIDPDVGANDTYCVIYTSRKPVNLPESTVIIPSGLKIDYLDSLLDGFTNSYVGAYKFGEQREILRSKVKSMIGELNGTNNDKPVPLSILRLMIEKASTMIDQHEELINLPNTIIHLFDSYVTDLFRKVVNPDLTIRQLRKAALISLGMNQILVSNLKGPYTFVNKWTCRPQWTPEFIYANYLDKDFLQLSCESGIMITSGIVGDKKFKFTHDPIAEYLASKELTIQIRDHLIESELAKNITIQIEHTNPSLHNLFLLNNIEQTQ